MMAFTTSSKLYIPAAVLVDMAATATEIMHAIPVQKADEGRRATLVGAIVREMRSVST